MEKGGPAFSALKKLISTRNKLVHNKSIALIIDDPRLPEKLKKISKDFYEFIQISYRAVVSLSLTMDKLTGSEFNSLISFDKKVSPLLDLPENVEKIVNECKDIVGRSHVKDVVPD